MDEAESSSTSSDEELFVVEDILARKKMGSKVYYLLKWEGYDDTTWEPAENILDKEMLQKFDRKYFGETDHGPAKPVIECDICQRKKGTMYKCQKCSIHRHEHCIDEELLDLDVSGNSTLKFTCDVCRNDQMTCYICRSSTAADETRMRCRLCLRVFHEACSSEFDQADSCCFECGNYPPNIEQVLTMRPENREVGIMESEFLVKFETWSHRKCFWVPESWLNIFCKQRLRSFLKEPVQLNETEVIMPNWCRIDRILYEELSATESSKFLVKWKDLGPEKATWEDESSAGQFHLFNKIEITQDEFTKAYKRYRKSLKINRKWAKVKPSQYVFKKLESQDVPVEGQLMQYQLEGVNWMLYNWHKERNCLLADEMGLGKTIQSITFIEHLRLNYGVFPILVIAPSTVCDNWSNELDKWAPKIHHMVFGGGQEARGRLVEYELFNDQMELTVQQKRQNLIKNHVVITSFQILNRECSTLKCVPWQMIIVDEAHRLKGSNNLLSRQLEGFKPCFRLLLTGTPLQNNIGELFNILSFLDPDTFDDVEELSKRFENFSDEKAKIEELHDLLRPRILRRTKKDVGLDESIPPKREIMVPVSMGPPQMAIYKSIIEKNYKILASLGNPGSKKVSLTNIWMELRKCVNHAYLVVDEPRTEDPAKAIEQLLSMSGKLELLDKMLLRLKEQGHRVLIFSQMTRMLDIIQDYLDMRGYGCGRLDGQTPVEERPSLIDEFNAPNSNLFCFLLSTRAGGLGINLTTADTVIIFDHDYNPHNDLQALCRAHRIGQKNVLHIYRLVTVNSIEESVVAIAKKKLVLDHLVVESMNNLKQSDIATILRMGVQKLFGDEPPQRIIYNDKAVELLLDRTQPVGAPISADKGDDETSASTDNVNIFNEEVFSHARVWEDEDGKDLQKSDAQFWSQLLPPKDPSPKKEYGKGQRRRKPANLAESALFDESLIETSSDSNWEVNNSEGSSSSSDSENMAVMADEGDALAGFIPGHPAAEQAPYSQKLNTPSKILKKAAIPKVSPTAPQATVQQAASRPTVGTGDGGRRMTPNDVYEMLTRVTVVPCNTAHLVRIIKNSHLLTKDQLRIILSTLPAYYYDPLARPYPEYAHRPHSLYGLLAMNLHDESGLFAILMLREANRHQLFTFFIPQTRLHDPNAGYNGSLSSSTSSVHVNASPMPFHPPAPLGAVNVPVAHPRMHQPQHISGVSTSDERMIRINVPKNAQMPAPLFPVPVNSSVSVRPTMPIGSGGVKMSIGANNSLTSSLVLSRPESPPIVEWQSVQVKPVTPSSGPALKTIPASNIMDLTDSPKQDHKKVKLTVNEKPAIKLMVNEQKIPDAIFDEKPTRPKKLDLEPPIVVPPMPAQSKAPIASSNPSPIKQRTIGTTALPSALDDKKSSLDSMASLILSSSESVTFLKAVSVTKPILRVPLHKAPEAPQPSSGSAFPPVELPPPSSSPMKESPRATRRRGSLADEEDSMQAKVRKTEAPATPNDGLSEVQRKIAELQKELEKAKHKEALLLTQAAQLKRMGEENSRLKRENEMLRTIATSVCSGRATPLSVASSRSALSSNDSITKKSLEPAKSPIGGVDLGDFGELPSKQRYKCCWSGCMHEATSKSALRSHAHSQHVLPQKSL